MLFFPLRWLEFDYQLSSMLVHIAIAGLLHFLLLPAPYKFNMEIESIPLSEKEFFFRNIQPFGGLSIRTSGWAYCGHGCGQLVWSRGRLYSIMCGNGAPCRTCKNDKLFGKGCPIHLNNSYCYRLEQGVKSNWDGITLVRLINRSKFVNCHRGGPMAMYFEVNRSLRFMTTLVASINDCCYHEDESQLCNLDTLSHILTWESGLNTVHVITSI